MNEHNLTSKTSRKPKRWLIIAIPAIIILTGAIAVGLYVSSLTSLIRPPEYTGDPSLNESDIFDPEDMAPTPTPPPTTPGATNGTTAVEPSETEVSGEVEAAVAAIAIPQDDQVYNILLIGTDNRGNERNGRSDTMMILSVNKRTQEIHIASLMRALYVKIPDHKYSMLNASFSWGGAPLLLQTIEDNFRIHIDDYLLIDFSGFQQAVDTIGGVTIDLTEAEAAYMNKANPAAGLRSGANRLDGTQALAYARIRKLDSDFKRTGRQRNVIEALIKESRSLSLGQIDRLARQILPLIKTNKSGGALLKLVLDGYSWLDYPISQLMLPIDGSHKMIIVRKAQMEQYDALKNIEALHQFLYE